jgi:hypothetical protein
VQRVEKRRRFCSITSMTAFGLGTGRLEVAALVVNREAPLDLLAMRRAVVVERVRERREGLFEPAFVQYRPVGSAHLMT